MVERSSKMSCLLELNITNVIDMAFGWQSQPLI
jgi:hypothetical protein